MKKAILFLAACFCLAIAKAESVKYMTFQTTDGTEHSLSLSGGIDISFANGELVAKVVRMAKELGREVATSAEAREILGLKPRK